MRDFMSKVRFLASARTLRAARAPAARAPAARVVRAVTLEPVKACGSDWKVRHGESAAALFAEAPGALSLDARVRARGRHTAGRRRARVPCDSPPLARQTFARGAARIARRARFPSAPFRRSATRISAGGKASKIDTGRRRTSRRTVRATRGEACMTPCIVLRLVVCAVGERSHEPVARRVTRRPCFRRTRRRKPTFYPKIAFSKRQPVLGTVGETPPSHRRLGNLMTSDSCHRPQPLGHGRQRQSSRG